MSGRVAELQTELNSMRESTAQEIANLWVEWDSQRQTMKSDWMELRNYLFATDTTSTTNSGLPWKNSTTMPKLCTLRDNLHANYLAALFPNSNWMKWHGSTLDDDSKDKSRAITAYMTTKTRESNFRDVGSQLVYDFIDYGNAFAEVEYVKDEHVDEETGITTTIYEGPRARRISPYDIVFNPVAPTFDESPKIVRKIVSLGELVSLSQLPNGEVWEEAIKKHDLMNKTLGSYSVEDREKAEAFSIDGFGTLQSYYQSDYVEVLEFKGDFFNKEKGVLERGVEIAIIDRSFVVYNRKIENWLGKTSIVHVGWRYRPDNLWAMGPLDNLVGMQYRIDHLENLKADAMDLAVHPPLVVQGDVDPFEWGPGSIIPIVNEGSVQELGKNIQGVIAAENMITAYENKMEEFAGAPKQAMGIRTPGQKTAFEVEQLQTAAGRIFQEKVTLFETNLLEPLLNLMLECSRRNLDAMDIVRSFDDDFGVEDFLEVTRSDITARGKIRPMGARHFGEQARLLQNISQLFQSPVGQAIMPHISVKNLAYLVEDVLQVNQYELVRPHVGLVEQAEAQQMAGNLEQASLEQQSVPF